MKRIILLLAAIVCLATSAMAQNAEDQPLSPALWKQGIATCAHYTACDRRFGKKIEVIKEKFPQGYTLDNLNNDIYNGQGRKWERIYNEFKKEENKAGSINDLKAMVTPQVWKLVEPDFKAFITAHPEIANAVPDTPEAEGENNPEGIQKDNPDGMAPPAGPRHDRHHDRRPGGPSCAANCPCGSAYWVRCWVCVPC